VLIKDAAGRVKLNEIAAQWTAEECLSLESEVER